VWRAENAEKKCRGERRSRKQKSQLQSLDDDGVSKQPADSTHSAAAVAAAVDSTSTGFESSTEAPEKDTAAHHESVIGL